MSFGVFTGIWGLVGSPFFFYSSAVGLKNYWEGPPQVPYDTNVRVHFGAARGAQIGDLGGHQPAIALFAEDGTRTGDSQWKNKQWAEGSFVDIPVKAKSRQYNRNAAYLAISAGGWDGICIAAIEISHPDGSKSSISGDMIVGCKNQRVRRYYSNKKFGDNYRPNCFWIDKDGTAGIPHQGMSVHLPDLMASEARAKQYNEHIETWCSSQPRFAMHEKMNVGSNIPIFWPKLSYYPDGTDMDFNQILHPTTIISGSKSLKVRMVANLLNDAFEGANGNTTERPVNLQTVSGDIEEGNTLNNGNEITNGHPVDDENIDEDTDEDDYGNQNTDGQDVEDVDEPIGEDEVVDEPMSDEIVEDTTSTRRLTRRAPAAPRPFKRQDDSPFHIRSKHPEHSAAALCDMEESYGPSFTNAEEGLHCDMATKTLYPLCAEGVTEECFDDEANEIREAGAMPEVDGDGRMLTAAAAMPRVIKKYAQVEDWD